MRSYLRSIRAALGPARIIHPAARILVENARGEFLIVERTDTGRIGVPAGGLEEGEDIAACIRREVREETGLQLEELTVIGISSHPDRETVTYPNGDCIQYFTVEFYCRKWAGRIDVRDTAEVRRARFAPREELTGLPPNERSILASLAYFRQHGRPQLK
jgi:8-oxo-dGTP pyrophosphatase MutT (NUDIX family)